MKKATIHVVDDDQAVRESIEWLIESVGLNIRTYGSANEFLDNYTEDSLGCLILDVRMPGISGLDLQHILTERGIDLSIVFVTGHGDVPMAVRALKNGAVDFIEKPFNDQLLLDTIQSAVQKHRHRLKQRAELENLQTRYDNLTTREQEVMDRVVTGKPNRDVGGELGISVKTVEVHRAKVMEKNAGPLHRRPGQNGHDDARGQGRQNLTFIDFYRRDTENAKLISSFETVS